MNEETKAKVEEISNKIFEVHQAVNLGEDYNASELYQKLQGYKADLQQIKDNLDSIVEKSYESGDNLGQTENESIIGMIEDYFELIKNLEASMDLSEVEKSNDDVIVSYESEENLDNEISDEDIEFDILKLEDEINELDNEEKVLDDEDRIIVEDVAISESLEEEPELITKASDYISQEFDLEDPNILKINEAVNGEYMKYAEKITLIRKSDFEHLLSESHNAARIILSKCKESLIENEEEQPQLEQNEISKNNFQANQNSYTNDFEIDERV